MVSCEAEKACRFSFLLRMSLSTVPDWLSEASLGLSLD